MKNWTQYGDHTMECNIVLKASYDEVASLFEKFIHSDFCVKFVSQKENFRRDVNTYKVKLIGIHKGVVADYFKGLKNKPVVFDEFKNEVERLKTFADAKLF
jgi:hypothetical protein